MSLDCLFGFFVVGLLSFGSGVVHLVLCLSLSSCFCCRPKFVSGFLCPCGLLVLLGIFFYGLRNANCYNSDNFIAATVTFQRKVENILQGGSFAATFQGKLFDYFMRATAAIGIIARWVMSLLHL